ISTAGLSATYIGLPAEWVGDGENLTITLDYDSAISPAELGMNDDARPLALMIDRISFMPSEP
ncbi:MAG: hypothetical protein KJ043_07645, partial [Anaerolineae bacterium]|nr:hypothetical protein [Anaerolineae bacterium]